MPHYQHHKRSKMALRNLNLSTVFSYHKHLMVTKLKALLSWRGNIISVIFNTYSSSADLSSEKDSKNIRFRIKQVHHQYYKGNRGLPMD